MLTKIEGVPDRATAHPGMAHFAGTGPFGERCKSCIYFGYLPEGADRFSNRCKKFLLLTGRDGPVIKGNYEACKYFERIYSPVKK
jgi:hypothetical protein